MKKKSYNIFKNYQNKFQFDLKLKMNDKPIRAVNEINFLGAIFDRTLNWSSHTQKILFNFRPILELFYRLNAFIPKKNVDHVILFTNTFQVLLLYRITGECIQGPS